MGYRRGYRRGISIPRPPSAPKAEPDADGTIRVEFSSASEILGYVAGVGRSNHSVSRGCDSSFNPFTWKESVEMLKGGWPEGVKEIAFNTDKINDAIDEASGYGIEYDTSGDYIDIGAFLEGTPECFGKVVTAEGPKETVKIVVAVTAAHYVDQELIRNRGAAICALVDQLRKTHFVSLDVVINVNGCMRHDIRTTFHLDMENGYSRDLLAFYIANPAMLRRIWFAIVEVATGHENCDGYGMVVEGEPVKDAINFPMIDNHNRHLWSTVESSAKQVQRMLDQVMKRQGQ